MKLSRFECCEISIASFGASQDKLEAWETTCDSSHRSHYNNISLSNIFETKHGLSDPCALVFGAVS